MKKLILYLLTGTALACTAFISEYDRLGGITRRIPAGNRVPLSSAIEKHSFTRGEELNYQINFGFLKAGEAKMTIEDRLYQVKGNPCFKIDFYGKTTGAASWIADVDDNWGAYVDAVDLKPHISYRNIHENNYRKKEVAEFNHNKNLIHYKDLNVHTGEVKSSEVIQATNDIFDIICGMAYLRNYDMNSMAIGDTLKLDAFMEDTIYNFRIVYYGKDKVKTKAGDFRAHVLRPIMPENKLFSGNQPITVWFSDDANQIPVRMDADFVIGKGKCMLSDYHNLKNELNVLN